MTPMPTPAAGAAPLASSAPSWALWVCPMTTAVLLYLCYFPVSIGELAWVALVPLLVLVRMPGRPKRLYLSCFVAAMAFHWVVLQWVRVADWMMYFAWTIVATYGALYWPVALAVLRWLDRRTSLPLVVTVPAVWVSFEYVRYGMAGCFVSLISGSHQHDVPGGFGWYVLGHTQHDFLEVIQISDMTGAFGVTALVAAVNALLFEILCGRAWFRRVFLGDARPARTGKTSLLLQGAAVATLLLLSLGYGAWRLREPLELGPRLVLVQTNVDQARRNEASGGDEERQAAARREVATDFAQLAEYARRQKPDLIVTPETSYPGTWREDAPGVPTNGSRKLAHDVTAHVQAPILLGMSADVRESEDTIRSYNSSVLIGANGRWLGRYDKIHRVPFGEYVPMKVLPFMKAFAPYDYDYEVAPGKQFTQFPLATARGTHTFGVMICYEDTDPAMARPYGGGGKAQADFLLNVSNDGWFKGSSEHDQHLAICRFRAVECRRSVGRAVNVGVSALIDPNGRVLAPELVSEQSGVHVWHVPDGAGSLPPSRWRDFKKVGGVIVGRVPLDERKSVYARYGDWFSITCLGFVSLWCVGLFFARRPAE
jgi:apolipoprotein N-acyltransferase